MNHDRRTAGRRAGDDLTEGVADLDQTLTDRKLADRDRQLADRIATQLRDCGATLEGPPEPLRQVFARWPEDLARRVRERDAWVGPTRTHLASAYPVAVRHFQSLVRLHGAERAVVRIAELMISGVAAPERDNYDVLTHWDPPIGWTLFGDGRVLLPWLTEAAGRTGAVGRAVAVCLLAQPPFLGTATAPWLVGLLGDVDPPVRFNAALCLSELAPETPGLAEALLGWLTECEDLAERLLLQRAYPPSARQYMPVDGLASAEKALGLLSPSRGASASPTDSPLFCHAAAVVSRRVGCEAGLLSDLADALGHEDPSVRRTAALAIGFFPGDLTPALPRLVTALGHDDRYVERMCAITLHRAGLLGIRFPDSAGGDQRWEYHRVDKAAAFREAGPRPPDEPTPATGET